MDFDPSQFFNPNAFGAWSPTPASWGNATGMNSPVAPTPSGLLGSPFMSGASPGAATLTRPATQPGPTVGSFPPALNPAPGPSPSAPGMWGNINNALGKAAGNPNFATGLANMAKMFQSQPMKAPAPSSIPMAQPVGPGQMNFGNSLAGILSPLMSRFGGAMGGAMSGLQSNQPQAIMRPY